MYRVNSFAGSKSWLGRVHVALVCVCATGAALGAPSGDRDTTVFYDAQVFTAEPDHPYADAVAIRGTASSLSAISPRSPRQRARAHARSISKAASSCPA